MFCDLAVMLADGGRCVSDLLALSSQPALFGEVASVSTARRVLLSIGAAELDRVRVACAQARERAWVAGAARRGGAALGPFNLSGGGPIYKLMRRLRVRSLGVAIVVMMVAFVGPPAIGGEVGIGQVQQLIAGATDSSHATTLALRSLNHLTLTLHDAATSLNEPGREVAGEGERWTRLDEAFATAEQYSSGTSVQALARAAAEYRQARVELQRPGGDAGRTAARRDLAAAERTTLLVADQRDQTIPALISPLKDSARHQQLGVLFGVIGTLLVGLAMALWLRRSIQRPLRSLKAAARRLEAGDFQAVDVHGLEDFEPIVEAFNAMAKQLETDRTELVETAYHDHLTGLANRALFFVQVNAMLAEDQEFCVLFIDLDGFKEINDTHGHAAGDQVLIDVSVRLTEALRPNDLLTRLGGDEFAVLLRGTASRPEAAHIADRLLLALATPLFVHNAALTVRASIGIAMSDGVTTASEILSDADHAMYAVKHASQRPGPLREADHVPNDDGFRMHAARQLIKSPPSFP